MDGEGWFITAVIATLGLIVGSIAGLAALTENETKIIPTGDGCVLVVYKENNLFGADRDYSGRYCQQ